MKKPFIIVLAIIIVAGAVLAILRFGLGGDEDTWICSNGAWVRHGNPTKAKPTTGCNTSIANTTTNVNVPAPEVTYVPYTGQNLLYTFDTVKEWTSIAPEEVIKSITEEQRHGYEIRYYASNQSAVVLSVSEKQSSALSTIAEIVADDKAAADADKPVTWINETLGQSDARTTARHTSGTIEYTVYSRYLITFSQAGDTRWAMMEVAIPSSRTGEYSAVVAHLLDSLMIAPASGNANNAAQAGAFAATGEKVNERVYQDKVSTIEFGVLAKNADQATARYGQPRINYQNEQLLYHITTAGSFVDNSLMTIKVYDYAAGRLFDGSTALNVRQGENKFCCYSPPGQGRYQYLFYLGSDLVKAIDLMSE